MFQFSDSFCCLLYGHGYGYHMALAVLNVPIADAALVFFVFLMEVVSKHIPLLIVNFNVTT